MNINPRSDLFNVPTYLGSFAPWNTQFDPFHPDDARGEAAFYFTTRRGAEGLIASGAGEYVDASVVNPLEHWHQFFQSFDEELEQHDFPQQSYGLGFIGPRPEEFFANRPVIDAVEYPNLYAVHTHAIEAGDMSPLAAIDAWSHRTHIDPDHMHLTNPFDYAVPLAESDYFPLAQLRHRIVSGPPVYLSELRSDTPRYARQFSRRNRPVIYDMSTDWLTLQGDTLSWE